MATWETLNLNLALEQFKPILEAVKIASQAAQVVTTPLLEVLNLAAEVISLVDASKLDISFVTALLGTVDVVHLYPTQPYQVMRYTQWAETAAFSLGAGPGAPSVTLCTTPPYTLFGFAVEASSVGLLVELAARLRAFFGFASTGFNDILPLGINRPLLRIEATECVVLPELIPVFGDLLEFTQVNVQFSAAGPVAALQRVLLAKLQALIDQIERINAILRALEALDLPAVKSIQAGPFLDKGGVYQALIGADGIDPTAYTAGSAMVADLPSAAALGLLLGVA